MNSHRRLPNVLAGRDRGFTLIELMITLIISSLIAAALITVLIMSSNQKNATANEVTSTSMARTALDMLSRDLRSAGFGIDNTYSTPQPPIAYVDSMQILINADQSPYPDTSTTNRGIPLAYNPNGNPRPYPLVGTSWAPPIRYRTGAELIRWTLDLNNDGQVNSTDFASTDAADANRTLNPNDYELCREVYGDSTAGVAGNNGGARERIALIKKPGGSQPPLFRVYMEGSSTPWNWSNGPIPANRLQEIVRIELNVVATSPNKNFLGQFTDTKLTTTVNEIRNSPNYSATTYNISGIVFNDANKSHDKQSTELGIANAVVQLSGYLTQTTGSTGSYSFDVPPGTYTVKQTPPDNYGPFSNPDSFIVTVGPSVTHDFADTARAGGWVTVTVYNDVDKNHSYGGSDTPMLDLPVSMVGSNDIYNTDANGQVVIFAPVGNYSIKATVPDSFIVSTANPITGTMTNGATKTGSIGMYIYDSGTVAGTVFNDDNGNGIDDPQEAGVPNAYVSCVLPDSTLIYTYSDKNGNYAIKLPTNDPPKTTPYTVTCSPPAGFASGVKTSRTGIFVQTNKTLASQDFGLGSFQTWKHDVDHPMAVLVSCDAIENDWTGSQTKHAHQDPDLIGGTDMGSPSKLEEWFNQYDRSPLFLNNPDATRTTVNSVISITADTLYSASGGFTRPAIITGQRYSASGNLVIWQLQSSSGNEGFLGNAPSLNYSTSDNGDVTAVCTVAPAAGNTPDILVGTSSPAAGQGVIELWHSVSHVAPNFTRTQIIPNTGGVPGGTLGAVTSMCMGPINSNVAGDELVVGTTTGYYSGQVMVFKLVSGVWTYDWGVTLASDAVTAVTIADVDNDGKKDIVVGTQTGHASGRLLWYKNKGGNPVTFNTPVAQTAPGVVTALAHADYGGDGIDDIVVGYRTSDLGYSGGVQIWFTTSKTLPASGIDATGGQITNWVTDIITTDLNYGVWPSSPPANPLIDIAGITRKDATHGQIFTLIR